MFKSKLKFDRQVMEEANSRRSSRVATPTGSNCFPDSILDIEEKVMFIMPLDDDCHVHIETQQ